MVERVASHLAEESGVSRAPRTARKGATAVSGFASTSVRSTAAGTTRSTFPGSRPDLVERHGDRWAAYF